jgi:hypothetical protein
VSVLVSLFPRAARPTGDSGPIVPAIERVINEAIRNERKADVAVVTVPSKMKGTFTTPDGGEV